MLTEKEIKDKAEYAYNEAKEVYNYSGDIRDAYSIIEYALKWAIYKSEKFTSVKEKLPPYEKLVLCSVEKGYMSGHQYFIQLWCYEDEKGNVKWENSEVDDFENNADYMRVSCWKRLPKEPKE